MNDKLDYIKESTLMTLHYSIEPELSPGDFQKSLTKSQVQVFDEKFEKLLINQEVIGIKIWNTEGVILYSSGLEETITYSKSNNNIIEALSNKVSYTISELNKEQDHSNTIGKAIKIYAPIIYDNKVVGVFEMIKS